MDMKEILHGWHIARTRYATELQATKEKSDLCYQDGVDICAID